MHHKMTHIKLWFGMVFVLLFLLSFTDKVSAANLSFSPASSHVSVGNIISVTLVVGTGGDVINSADGTIQFPSDMLDVMSISKSPSIFSLWVEDPSFDNSAGTVTFDGGLPNPGYGGNTGQIISIVFRAKKTGTASIVFSDSAVRKNDGLGTNILTGSSGTTITIDSNATAQVAPPPVSEGTPSAPIIASATHPEQSKWYNNSDVELQWKVPSDVTAVETLVGRNPASVPTVVYSPVIGSKKISQLEDGVWYFHVRFKNSNGWGETSHYKIQIDTVPPNPFKIAFPHGAESTDPRPVIHASATDDLSGIDNYEVKIDDGDFTKVSPQDMSSGTYSLLDQDPGVHNMLVKAVDLAGNETVQTAQFTVTPINQPQIQNYQSELQSGDLLKITGVSYPSASVEIVVKDSFGNDVSQMVNTLASGDFSMVWLKKLDIGPYTFTARAIDSNGAKSVFTSPSSFVVKQSAVSHVSSFVFGWLSIIVIIVLALGGITLLITYFVHKFIVMKKTIDKKMRVTESSVHKAFDLLRENVREQVKTLEGAKSKRQLTKEEEKVIKRLQENLTESEKYLEKEIQDIEETISK